MMTFIFAVLGSVIFWIVYGCLTMVAVTVLLKKMAPKTFGYITDTLSEYKKEDYIRHGNLFEGSIFIIILFVSWPIFLTGYFIIFIVKILFYNGFCNIIKTIDKSLPNIEINKKEEK